MSEISFPTQVADRYQPFLQEVLAAGGQLIHSVHVSGGALTADFDPRVADIHSVIVLQRMEFGFLKLLAPRGKKYGKKGITAPLIMTPEYINSSLDVFPIEFLDLKLLHRTVHGEDLLENLEIGMTDLRQQCERELKSHLISLRQGYLSAAGDRKMLAEGFLSHTYSRYLPLFRGVAYLMGTEPAIDPLSVLKQLKESTGMNFDGFETIFRVHSKRQNLSMDELNNTFTQCYQTLEQLGNLVDEYQN